MQPAARTTVRHVVFVVIGLVFSGGFVYFCCIKPAPWRKVTKQESRWGAEIESVLGINLPATVWERPVDARHSVWALSFAFPEDDFESIADALGLEKVTAAEYTAMVVNDDSSEIPAYFVPPEGDGRGLIPKSMAVDHAKIEFYLTPHNVIAVIRVQ